MTANGAFAASVGFIIGVALQDIANPVAEQAIETIMNDM
jgi:hypothetical protein